MQLLPQRCARGFSFVEVLVTAALVALVFGGLFAVVTSMVKLIGDSKAKAGATALAVQQVEYLRSLPYASVGTDGGVPAGNISPLSTTSINGLTYTMRTLVEYVDDAADGFGGADSNGILADYKRAKVELSWDNRGSTSSLSLVTTIMPIGIESTVGGGTIRVNVFDAATDPVSNAAVRFVNDTTTTTIDTTRYTNTEGIAYLAGAPAAANYQIYVTKTGYSSDQTYIATTTNPNPSTPLVTVTESLVSTMNFAIDRLSSLTVRTVGVPSQGSWQDTFTDTLGIATSTAITIAADSARLTASAGLYEPSGTILSTSTTPSPLERWYTLAFNASTSASTSVTVAVYYDNSGVWTRVPDSELPGNSVGFTTSPIDLQPIDSTLYDELALGAVLTTIDPIVTPTLHDWIVTHIATEPTLNGLPVSIVGAKVIGTDVSALPIYKFANNYTTDSNGEVELTSLEYDVYTIDVTSASKVTEVCTPSPVTLAPNQNKTVQLTLDTLSGSFLRVEVVDPAGNPVADAVVELSNAGYYESNNTSLCGQTYFNGGGLYADGDYLLDVSKTGYSPTTVASTTVAAASISRVVLSPL